MDFKRMVREKSFWLAVFLAFLGLVFGTAWPEWKRETVFPSGTFLELAKESLKSRTVLYSLPILAVIPWSETYLKERQWNFLRIFIIRKGKKEYSLDRIITTAFSGMLVWVLASFIQVLFFFLLFFWKEAVFTLSMEQISDYFTLLFRISLVASAVASFGGFCAAAGNSVYLAMGLPFVLFFSLIILRQRYLEDLYCLDPWEWIRGEGFWGSTQRGIWIFLVLLNLALLALHKAALEKRLEEI